MIYGKLDHVADSHVQVCDKRISLWHVTDLPDHLDATSFTELIKRETGQIELKTGVSSEKVQEAMVAFSNAAGGVIFVGVKDDRTVVGRALDQGTDDAIHSAARSARDLGRYRVKEIQVGQIRVVAIIVEPRQEGFAQTSNGRVLQRRGAANPALMGQDLWAFMSARAYRRFESTETTADLTDVDPQTLDDLAASQGWLADRAAIRDRLVERGLMTANDRLSIAGALLLTDPVESLASSKMHIDIRRYPDESINYDRRVEITGSLPRQITHATRFVMDELGTDMVVSGVNRHEVPKLPEVVIREVIANAAGHRSYEIDRVSIQIDLRPGRVEITSPGRLPEPVTLETLRSAQSARNPVVIDTLRKLRLAEDAGRGIDVIEDSMAAALLDPPSFTEPGDAVRVTLPLTGPMSPQERAWVGEIDRQSGLSGADRILLVHAARGENLTNGRAREILVTDALSARKSLRHLVEVGLLESSGERAGTRYRISPSVSDLGQHRIRPTEARQLVLAAARENPLSNADVRRLLGVNRDEALKILRQLVDDDVLAQSGAKRGTTYSAKDRAGPRTP